MVPHLNEVQSGVEGDRQVGISVHPHGPLEMRLWIGVLMLLAVGFVMIYSASSAIALRKFADASYYLKRQALFASVGIVVVFITSRVPYRIYEDLVYWLLLGAIAALALVTILWEVLMAFHQKGDDSEPVKIMPEAARGE